MRQLARQLSAALGMFLLIALLWAAIGFRYHHDQPWAAALRYGGIALAIGWVFVGSVVAVKYVRIAVRRHRSNVAAQQ